MDAVGLGAVVGLIVGGVVGAVAGMAIAPDDVAWPLIIVLLGALAGVWIGLLCGVFVEVRRREGGDRRR